MFKCDWKYKIYLPKPAGDKVVKDASMIVKDGVKGLVNAYFGGYTIYEAEGGWEDSNGKLIKEPGYIIETVTDRSEAEKPLEHITNFILGNTKESMVLITKSPVEIIEYERKDYHNE